MSELYSDLFLPKKNKALEVISQVGRTAYFVVYWHGRSEDSEQTSSVSAPPEDVTSHESVSWSPEWVNKSE